MQERVGVVMSQESQPVQVHVFWYRDGTVTELEWDKNTYYVHVCIIYTCIHSCTNRIMTKIRQ